MIHQPDGILLIVTNSDTQEFWREILGVAAPHLDQPGLRRLATAISGRARSAIVERHYIDKDYRDTFANFHAKKFATPDSRCVRIHFFEQSIDPTMIRSSDHLQPQYLGYVVLRPTKPNCVGRTLLETRACGLTDYHVCLCDEDVSIQGTILRVRGFPFISQDTDVTVCAQSALWMVARYFSNRYRSHPEIYPFQIGELTRDYSVGRLFPTGRLYVWQMAEVLRRINYSPLI